MRELKEYKPDKIRSSKNYILPSNKYFLKQKPSRTLEKTFREFYSLMVWSNLLDSYKHEGSSLNAPHPIGLSDGGCIFMEFMPGIVGKRISNYRKGTKTDVGSKNLHEDFIEKVAYLCKVKEINKLVHGDFDLRHLIYDKPTGLLSVVDVENSRIDRGATMNENTLMELKLDKSFNTHIKPRKVDDLFDDAYQQVKLSSRVGSAIVKAEKDLTAIPRISDVIDRLPLMEFNF